MDADEDSVIPTVEGEIFEDAVYEVEEILAEKWDVWEHDPDQPVFRGTWEPKEAFSVPDTDGNALPEIPPILQTWYDRKQSMDESEFRNYCRVNIESFYVAIESAEKREKERQKRARPVLLDSDEEEESNAPGILQTQASLQHAASHDTAADTRNSSSGKQPLATRKPPLEQSDSSSCEAEPSNLPRAGSSKPLKKTADSLAGTKDAGSPPQSRRNSVQTSRIAVQSATAIVDPKSIQKPIRFKTVQIDVPQGPSQSSKAPVPQAVKPATSAPAIDSNKKLDKCAVLPSVVTQRIAAPSTGVTNAITSSASPASIERSSIPAGPASVKKANQDVGIKVVNEPKIQQRSEWKNGTALFSTLHFRGMAQKRSRIEGTPNPAALEIFNDVSGVSKPRSPATYDNPYGRREAGRGRADRSPVDDDRNWTLINESPADGNVPLAPWEVDKIPLVCASWRLSSNCPKNAQTCPFMHRNKDQNGIEYPVGDMDGRVPPKYRKPPLTCAHWLHNNKGCFKPDDQCPYAHRNTGWMQNEKRTGENIVRIDQRLLPQHERADVPSTASRKQRTIGPHKLTCWYWAKDKCRNTAETCLYQHYDTGILARAPPSKEQDMPIDMLNRRDSTMTASTFGEYPLPQPNNTIDSETTSIIKHVAELAPASSLPVPAELPPARAKCENIREQISSACKLDFEELFSSNDSQSSTGLMDRRAFLVYHVEEHAKELDLITRWLLMHHVQLSGVHYVGGWEEFEQQIKEGGSGVMIVHPDFEYFTLLPRLGEILRYPIRLWSIGLQEGFEYDPALSKAPPVYRYDAIEIFPVGGFIYITDEVFENEPQLALKIVKSFFDKIEGLKKRIGPACPGREVQDASLLWRLCVRPELMEYLIQDCEEHQEALEAGDADMQSRAQLYTLLAETNYIEQDKPTEPVSAVFDKHPILSERRILAESEPMSYFTARARSREAANWNMVRYYAGLQVSLCRDYRHFFVVHPQPQGACVQQWRQQIQTIAHVLTPQECVDELSKDSQVSMFDFCEMFMREKVK